MWVRGSAPSAAARVRSRSVKIPTSRPASTTRQRADVGKSHLACRLAQGISKVSSLDLLSGELTDSHSAHPLYVEAISITSWVGEDRVKTRRHAAPWMPRPYLLHALEVLDQSGLPQELEDRLKRRRTRIVGPVCNRPDVHWHAIRPREVDLLALRIGDETSARLQLDAVGGYCAREFDNAGVIAVMAADAHGSDPRHRLRRAPTGVGTREPGWRPSGLGRRCRAGGRWR